MELKPGYKQTEVGVIPEDWDVHPLLKAVHIANGQVSPKHEPYRSMILVAPDHIESSSGKLLSKKTAADQGAISGKYMFERGDIIYSKIRPYLRKAILADFSGLCSADMYPLKPAPWVSGDYILAVILGRRFTRYAESVSVRSGMPKINRAEMADFAIAAPPLPEQLAIGNVLSDIDRLIRDLEFLIAKKRNIKQAAMQELLTGKRRLPGFEREWEVKKLGDIGTFFKGSGVTRDQSQGGLLACIRYGELYTAHGSIIREIYSWISPAVAEAAFDLKNGDILFAGSGETKEEIGKCAAFASDTEAYAGGDIIILRPKGCDSRFLGYFLNSSSIARQKASRGQGDAVVHISSSALSGIVIKIPDRQEQTSIADILVEMDAEIDMLEQQLSKTRALKQAMMQELLTGRIRLR